MVVLSQSRPVENQVPPAPPPDGAVPSIPDPAGDAPRQPRQWASASVVRRIGQLAVKWSLDNPDLREDLFQEGWLAAWQAELRCPDAPSSHLVRAAEERIRHVRNLGCSVDGKPNVQHARPLVYQVLHLDAPGPRGEPSARSLAEMVPSRVRDVAREVCGLLHAATFLAGLPGLDRRILGLRVTGYKWSEMTSLLRLQPRALHARRAALRESAARHWAPEGA